jgi:hypothetical protein
LTAPRKSTPPPGFVEIEKALHLLDLGEERRWVLARLRGLDSHAARQAVALLHRAKREEARAVLEAELLRMAGPEDARDLGWFSPAAEQVRGERQRPW